MAACQKCGLLHQLQRRDVGLRHVKVLDISMIAGSRSLNCSTSCRSLTCSCNSRFCCECRSLRLRFTTIQAQRRSIERCFLLVEERWWSTERCRGIQGSDHHIAGRNQHNSPPKATTSKFFQACSALEGNEQRTCCKSTMVRAWVQGPPTSTRWSEVSPLQKWRPSSSWCTSLPRSSLMEPWPKARRIRARDDNHCMLKLHSKGCHREVHGLVSGMSGWRSKNSDRIVAVRPPHERV